MDRLAITMRSSRVLRQCSELACGVDRRERVQCAQAAAGLVAVPQCPPFEDHEEPLAIDGRPSSPVAVGRLTLFDSSIRLCRRHAPELPPQEKPGRD